MGLFELSKEQTLIQHEVRKFTKTVIEPIERDLDDGKADLNDIYRQVVELGFAGSLIPEEFEGAGLDMISFCLVLEEIARSCASLSLILLVNNGLNGVFLLKSDHKEKQALLKKIAQGAVSGFVIPPDFDENVPDLKMIDNRLSVDATKFQLILNGKNPEFLIMPFIQPDKISIYLIKPSDKIRYTPISTLGMKIAGISEIHISGLELPHDQELIRGQNNKDYQKMLNTFRIGLAAIGIGISSAAFDTAFKYAQERKQFGRAIIEFPMVQDMLVTMKAQTEAARRVAFDAAAEQQLNGTLPLMARMLNTDNAVFCGKQSIQILGGYGYTKDYSVERYLRDAKTLQMLVESPFTIKDAIMKELL